MKAILTNIKFPIKQISSINLLKFNKMNMITKLNKINLEKKILFNTLLKKQFRTSVPISKSILNSIIKINITNNK